jgi:outer membrane protein OmpA-like peptidoglycan-associated protein
MRLILRSRRLYTSLFSLVLVMLSTARWAQVAHAQDRFNAEAFEPATDGGGSVLSVYGTRTLPQAGYALSLFGSYARRPLSIEDANGGGKLGDLIGSIGTLSLLGTVGLFDRVDIGIGIPLHRVSAGSGFATAPPLAVQAALVDSSQVALGDIRLVPRVSLIQRKADSGLGLALLIPVSLPTGDDKLYVGEPFRVEPRAAIDWAHRGVLLSANVGYLVRSKAHVLGNTIDDSLRWGVGAEIPLVGGLSALAEVFGALDVLAQDFTSRDTPTEAMIGARYRHEGWLGQLGGGPGIIRGITAPEWRLFAAFGYSHEPAATTAVADGDRDRDGVLDSLDGCPDLAEDMDGFEDADGCPDADNDKDGVPDAQDRCPLEPEDKDGFEDQDGCPDPDNDKDGVLDAQDRCPLEPEDKDGFEDQDGCPDPDNDKDGVLDAQDRCPNEAGSPDHEGCPAAEAPAKAEIADKSIELKESVLFGLNSAEIESASGPLLDDVARLLTSHPEIELVSVEGHTDDRGSAQHNRDLSQRRAEAVVKALVERSIASTRLKAQGYGPDHPLLPNTDAASRAKNRRVELQIERRAK